MTGAPSVAAAWRTIRDRFAAAGIGTAALDARLLAQHALGVDTTAFIMAETDPASEPFLVALEALSRRRLAGEPVARIVGRQEFYGRDFALNGATLVPRPETEMLVDFALAHMGTGARVLDLGTGTGCIVLSILAERADARGIGIDLAPEAVAMAQANARALGVADRFIAMAGDWYEPLDPAERFDCIVSNPPYIETQAVAGLAREVRDFDPALALDGGPSGLDPYAIIANGALARLTRGGAIALEIGASQGAAVREIIENAGFSQVEVHADLAGHDRMVTARA